MGKRLPVGLYIDRNDQRVRIRASTVSIDITGANALTKLRDLAPSYLAIAEGRVADAKLAADLRAFLETK